MRNRRRFLRGTLDAMTIGTVATQPWARSLARAEVLPAVDPHGPALGPLLARNRQKHPGLHTSNHSSMSLLSLAALGGTAEQIRTLGEEKLRNRTPFPSTGPEVTAQNWRLSLGDMDALRGFHALFSDEISRRGVAATLRLYLPSLLPGLGAHAFHPIIRTGYGIRFGDAAEVAMGLAYWSSTFLSLGPLGPPGAYTDPAAALAAARSTALMTPEGRRQAGVAKPDGLNIAGKMQWASTLTGFAPVASTLQVGGGSLGAIARTMLRLYLTTNDDFTALHGITGTHAYRMLEPFVTDRNAGRRYLWQALVAAYVTVDAPALTARAPVRVPSWADIVARAVVSHDDHELKLTDIAREEFRYYGDSTYALAAAVHLRLV
jgi:hypothetical protein